MLEFVINAAMLSEFINKNVNDVWMIYALMVSPPNSSVRRQNMKVRISATGDTIVMKFLRPNADTKLEGYILGYGSSMFSKQFIQLPENNGQPYETEFGKIGWCFSMETKSCDVHVKCIWFILVAAERYECVCWGSEDINTQPNLCF